MTRNERRNARRRGNPVEKAKRLAWYYANRYKHYGLTNKQYDKLLESQGGGCAICGRLPGKRMLAVDHDHDTGKARGLLCYACNSGLGNLQDSADILRKAIIY